MADMVGPWKRADIRSLSELCAAARKLGQPAAFGLLMPINKPFANKAEAHKAMQQHGIYKWLKAHMPLALTVDADEFELVQTLLRGMTIGFAEQSAQSSKGADRTDKKRDSAIRAIDRIEGCLDDATIVLVNAEKRSMLRQLLSEAKAEMGAHKAKNVKHPALADLAANLYRQFRTDDVSIVMAIAAAMGIDDCDERTARRYVKAAITA
jgi:hypothetical protein